MELDEAKYSNLFTTEERKLIIAQTMAELRKVKGLSQKEVAAQIGVSQATYSAYERGRNEPPAEVLVRLSYLFGCSLDILMQRERTYRTAADALKQAEQYRDQLAELKEELSKKEGDTELASAILELVGKLNEAVIQTAQRPDIAVELETPLKN